MSSQQRILIVDDEDSLRAALRDYLELKGFQVAAAADAAEARTILEREDIDLAVLDIRMPGEDGLSLALHIRENSQIGIIFLTASGEVIDRIVGLEIGADDYVPKPVDMRELLARIKAVLRRAKPVPDARDGSAPENEPAPSVRFGRCVLNLEAHKLVDENGREVPLTSMEFDLLKAFAEHPDRVLNRDQLLELAHNRGWDPFDRSIDIRIGRLRKKIERDPRKPQVIKTVRGAGYMFSSGSG